MAGIYIHIPFCRQKCHYCNFHFSTSLRQKGDLVAALVKEIELTGITEKNIETIYFGGGTPSLLAQDELEAIFTAISKKFIISADAEITLEANPDDINEAVLQQWKKAGINRLSIGIQSFNDDELKWMNRAHNAAEALACIDLAEKAGFTNYSVDLIYGSPLQSFDVLKTNLQIITGRKIPHISCYALTVEPKTALAVQIKKGEKQHIDTDMQAQQYLHIMESLAAGGYEHYEISNFALPGMRSRHNSSYWQGKLYYGFGPSAHSFNGINIRRWNIANNSLYIKALENDTIPLEEEILSPVQLANECIMTSVRLSEGLDTALFLEQFGSGMHLLLEKNIQDAIKKYGTDKIKYENNIFLLSNEGKLFADGIAAGLFL